MSEQRRDSEKRKENIPPAARGDAEWRDTAWSLPLWWVSGRWGWMIGELSALMGSARPSPCSVTKVINCNSERGFKGKFIRRSQV